MHTTHSGPVPEDQRDVCQQREPLELHEGQGRAQQQPPAPARPRHLRGAAAHVLVCESGSNHGRRRPALLTIRPMRAPKSHIGSTGSRLAHSCSAAPPSSIVDCMAPIPPRLARVSRQLIELDLRSVAILNLGASSQAGSSSGRRPSVQVPPCLVRASPKLGPTALPACLQGRGMQP